MSGKDCDKMQGQMCQNSRPHANSFYICLRLLSTGKISRNERWMPHIVSSVSEKDEHNPFPRLVKHTKSSAKNSLPTCIIMWTSCLIMLNLTKLPTKDASKKTVCLCYLLNKCVNLYSRWIPHEVRKNPTIYRNNSNEKSAINVPFKSQPDSAVWFPQIKNANG